MKQVLELKDESVATLFLKYLIPSVMGMFIMSLHVIIDGIFIGRSVGSDGLAAISIVSPLFALFVAIGLLIGVGGATVVSIKFGEGEEEKANSIFTQSILIALIIILTIVILGEFNIEKLAFILGANDKILFYVTKYMSILLYFAPALVLTDTISCFVRNDRSPKLAMYAMVIGAISNCCLNYIFIFIFRWGLGGAALATGVANIVSLVMLSTHIIFEKGTLRLIQTKFVLNDVTRIFRNGFPSFLSDISIAVVTLKYNLVLMEMIGETGVSAYSIINYIYTLMLMIFMGIAQAVQPIISYNYGAQEYERVRKSCTLAACVSVCFGICFFIAGILFGKSMAGLFSNNKELVILATQGMKIYFITYLFMGVNIVIASYFQAIEKTYFSIIVTLCRGFIFNVVGLFIFPKIFSITGVWLTAPVAEVLTVCICYYLFIHHLRKWGYYSGKNKRGMQNFTA